MARPVAASKSKPTQGRATRPTHLRLVEQATAAKNSSEDETEDRVKPELADELDDVWDNVPI